MTIRLWKGFHSPSLLSLIANSLAEEALLILCPPYLKNYDFLDYLPEGQIEVIGDWNEDETVELARKAAQRNCRNDYPQSPEFGIFTSGTLSLHPRLILFRREQAEASLAAIFALFESIQIDKIFCYPQPFHIFGFTLGYLHALFSKRELVALNGKYQQFFHQLWLSQASPHMMTLGAPVHFRDLLSFSAQSADAPSASATCIIGGASVSRELWQDINRKLSIQQPSIGYGATEACPGLSHLAPGVCPQESGDIGTWLTGVDVTLEPGRGLHFSGVNQCLAVIDTSSDVALMFPQTIFIADEIEKTAGGNLLYRGRSDWKLNRGAEKFSLEVIERELESQLNANLVAVALDDERLGETLGIVVHDPHANKSLAAKICALVKQNFGWALQEHEVLSLSSLPLSFNGKIDRKECQSLLQKSAIKNFELSRSH